MTTPAEVIAHARLAAHEERWGEGSGSLTTFREQAARDLDALAETGFMVVQKTASGRPVEVIETALREHMRVPMSGAEAGDASEIAVDALTRAGMVVVSAEDQQALRERAETAEQRLNRARQEHAAIHAEMDAYALNHEPDCECEVIPATRETADRMLAALDASLLPEEDTDARH